MSTFFFRLQFFLELANQSLNQDFGSREQLYWRSAKEFRASRASSESSGLPSTRLDRSIPPPILGNHWENVSWIRKWCSTIFLHHTSETKQFLVQFKLFYCVRHPPAPCFFTLRFFFFFNGADPYSVVGVEKFQPVQYISVYDAISVPISGIPLTWLPPSDRSDSLNRGGSQVSGLDKK